MSRRPTIEVWMPLHFADITKACSRMSDLGELYFLRILRDQWLNGPTPDAERALANVAGVSVITWRKVRDQLAPYFSIADGFWVHEPTAARREHALSVSMAKKRPPAKDANAHSEVHKCDPDADIRDLSSSSDRLVHTSPNQGLAQNSKVGTGAEIIPLAGRPAR